MSTQALDKWSVIIAGKDEARSADMSDEKHWLVADWQLGKVNRSKRDIGDSTYIDIGALRALKDCIADIDGAVIESFRKEHGALTRQSHVDMIRKNAGVDGVPLLIIYRIDKDSKAMREDRADLEAKSDIMGIHICIPGNQINKNFTKRLTIYLPPKDKEDEVEE